MCPPYKKTHQSALWRQRDGKVSKPITWRHASVTTPLRDWIKQDPERSHHADGHDGQPSRASLCKQQGSFVGEQRGSPDSSPACRWDVILALHRLGVIPSKDQQLRYSIIWCHSTHKETRSGYGLPHRESFCALVTIAGGLAALPPGE